MPMKNLDLLKEQKTQIMQRMTDALRSDNPEKFAQAWEELQLNLQDTVMAEARGLMNQYDTTVLAARGTRQLTSEENKYYDGLIQAMRSANPKQAIADYEPVLPKTVVDAVFDDLVQEHPLLEAINFQNTNGMIEFIVNTNSKQLSSWGVLTAEITKELTSGFKKINMTMDKLSAFIPVAKSMLDLGPAWLDRYVRAILGEASAFGLEEAIVNGTGKNMFIGMNRQVGTGVTVTDGVYPVKNTVKLTSFRPEVYGTFLAQLATDDNGNARAVTQVLFICNPTDYLTKVMPATTMLKPDGTYAGNVTPIPTRIIQSVQVPSGKAIIGLGKRYFAALGTAKSGKIEYDDSYHFLEDERMYLVKLYGHGEPLDNKAFVYADISELSPMRYLVENYAAPKSADLASLSIGSLTLSPAFAADKTEYTTATTNATNTITAAAQDGSASIEIKVGSTEVTNGGSATWASGSNTVTVKVTNGSAVKTYTVTVTKS
jgi:HK97 family phage major capsid protein|nr:MAG TPA: major capsid protein [Caudoviricetes sp.]